MIDPSPSLDELRARAASGHDVYEFLVLDAKVQRRSSVESAAAWSRAVTPPRERWAQSAGELLMAELNPEAWRYPLDQWFEASIQRMADEAAAAWVRAGLAERELARARGYYRGELADPADPADKAYLEWVAQALAAWDDAEYAVWRDVDWSGIDLGDAEARRGFEVQPRLAPGQVEWCRQQLRDPAVRGVALGLCLRRLLDADALTLADLDAIVPRWRSRLMKQLASETFACVPAVVAFGIALAEIAMPGRDVFWAYIRDERRRWEENVYAPLVGWYGSSVEVDELWQRLSGEASYRQCLGAVVGRARLTDSSVAEICDEAAAANPGLAATLSDLSLAFGQRPYLWAGRMDWGCLVWRSRAAESRR